MRRAFGKLLPRFVGYRGATVGIDEETDFLGRYLVIQWGPWLVEFYRGRRTA